jgi:hypothetical protein
MEDAATINISPTTGVYVVVMTLNTLNISISMIHRIQTADDGSTVLETAFYCVGDSLLS